jgi:branched-chain amino acid transport system ATP-binding protein
MLEIKNVVTSYGNILALKGVNLKTDTGKITCLLGPNGAGKTTLLMTIAGLLKPSRGTILFEGSELIGEKPGDIVRQGLISVPENRLVFPEMTVEDNLIAGAYIRGDKSQISIDIEARYERFPRLKERRKQLAGTLSGGEQQMLAISRALMANPKALLMDEPSLGLAPIIVEDIFNIITELCRDGISIFLVEQNAHMALQIANRFYLMDQGQIVFDGTPDGIEKDEIIQRTYLGKVNS